MTQASPRDWQAYLTGRGQGHLAAHVAALDPALLGVFERELLTLDFDLLDELVAMVRNPKAARPRGALAPPPIVRRGADPARDAAWAAKGRELLAQGKVACVLVAGGQGSRLKHPGPKGTYPATPVRKKPLFQVLAERIRARSRECGRPLTLCVMTSVENHEDTTAFFESHGRFGLEPGQVRCFTQGMLPAVDEQGRLVLRAPGALFLSPNGHGGTLLALRSSGLLDQLAAEGIEDLFYFQVDNPLVDVCDPVFLGCHRETASDFSSKVVAKAGPDEKVGVLAVEDGRMTLIEYSDLPAALREGRTADGSLRFSAGNIAIHALRLDFVRAVTEGRLRLPFHTARKTLAAIAADGTACEVAGVKFETFIFDALASARNPLAMEVRREDEFAPIKNATGVDSPETSRELQSAAAARLLEAAGIAVPRDAAGRPRAPIEISPLFAQTPAELRARGPLSLSFDAPVYLG